MSTLLAPAAAPDTAPSHGPDDVIHIVGYWHEIITLLLGRIPRALCGELLTGDPDRPEPGANAPVCPVCDRLAPQ